MIRIVNHGSGSRIFTHPGPWIQGSKRPGSATTLFTNRPPCVHYRYSPFNWCSHPLLLCSSFTSLCSSLPSLFQSPFFHSPLLRLFHVQSQRQFKCIKFSSSSTLFSSTRFVISALIFYFHPPVTVLLSPFLPLSL
jgi:hypothetical protein